VALALDTDKPEVNILAEPEEPRRGFSELWACKEDAMEDLYTFEHYKAKFDECDDTDENTPPGTATAGVDADLSDEGASASPRTTLSAVCTLTPATNYFLGAGERFVKALEICGLCEDSLLPRCAVHQQMQYRMMLPASGPGTSCKMTTYEAVNYLLFISRQPALRVHRRRRTPCSSKFYELVVVTKNHGRHTDLTVSERANNILQRALKLQPPTRVLTRPSSKKGVQQTALTAWQRSLGPSDNRARCPRMQAHRRCWCCSRARRAWSHGQAS
jgi:hypothetical protein